MNGIHLKMAKPSSKVRCSEKSKIFGGPALISKLGAITLPLLTTLLPNAALAEVCDKIRPNWEPGFPATAFGEALYLFTTLPAIILLMASLLVVLKRSQWGALALVVLWSGLVSIITFVEDPLVDEQALAEGCVGSPALFIVAVAAICIAMILITMPRETRL